MQVIFEQFLIFECVFTYFIYFKVTQILIYNRQKKIQSDKKPTLGSALKCVNVFIDIH